MTIDDLAETFLLNVHKKGRHIRMSEESASRLLAEIGMLLAAADDPLLRETFEGRHPDHIFNWPHRNKT